MAYDKHPWETKEPITKAKMQHIEDGIEAAASQADTNATAITNLTDTLRTTSDSIWAAFGYSRDSLKNKTIQNYINELTISNNLKATVDDLHAQVYGAITQGNTTLQSTIDVIRQVANASRDKIGNGFTATNTITSAIENINNALSAAKTNNYETLAGRINAIDEKVSGNTSSITNINNWRDKPTTSDKSATLLLQEIVGAHRTTNDTLDDRFDAIDRTLSDINGDGIKTKLTALINEIAAARESTANSNATYANLDARLEADEMNIKGVKDEVADAHRPGVENDNLNARFTAVESALSTAQTTLDDRIDTVEATANAAAVASEVNTALSGIDARLDALDGGSIADTDDGGSLTGRVAELEVALDYTPTSDEDTTPAGLTQRISAAESDIDTLEGNIGTINTTLGTKANATDVETALAGKVSTEAMNTAITNAVKDISTTIIKNKNEVAYTDNVPSNTQTWTISDKDDYLLQAADDKYYYWKHIDNAWHLMGGAGNGEGGGGTGNSNAEDYETYKSFSQASREENKDYYVLQDDGVRHHYRYLRSLNESEQEVWTLIEIGILPDKIKKYNIFKYVVPKTEGQSEKTYMHLCEYDYGYENVVDETFEQPFPAWTSGTSYQLDDCVIYDNYVYKCINENTDTTWTEANWQNLHVKIINTIELPQGGSGITSTITISNVVRPTTISNGKDARFSFKAITNDESDITSIKWYVDGIEIQPSATNEMTPSEGYGPSGITIAFNAKGLLKESNRSTVRVEMTSGNNARFSRSWTVQSNEFSISWNNTIQPIMLYTTGEEVNAIVNVVAASTMTNIVEVMVNNDSEHVRSRTVTGTNNVSFALDPSWFNLGENLVTAIMKNSNNEDDNTGYIHYTALWAYGASAPLLAFADSEVETRQYEEAVIRYYAYNPNNETSEVSLKFGDEEPHISNVGREMQTYRYISNEVQTIPVVLSTTYKVEQKEITVSDSLTLNVLASPYNLAAVSGDSLRYVLDPNGHNNTDANRSQFGNITFSNNFDWANGGFKQDADGATALVVKKGSTITLPRTLFAESDSTGKTIDISFKITNSDIYEAEAFSDLDNSASPKGLKLKANSGELYLMNSNPQTFHYCEENRIDLSIHVEGPVDQRLITIWLDGIPSYVGDYAQDMLVQNNTTTRTVIGSPNCDIWIYSIRVYNQALSEKDMIQNYIANGPNSSEKIKRFVESDIYDGNTKTTEYYSHPVITPEKLHAAMPNLTIIEIEAPRMTRTKKDPVPAHVKITDQILVTENDSTFYRDRVIDLAAATGPETKDGCVFKVQGTSSVAYARSALNMDIDFKNCVDADGNKIKYAISDNSIGVNYLNIKVNVASSENANNICAVDWYNQHQPFLIQARKDNAAIRDTVEGKPCAVFFTNTSNNTIWVSSQRVAPGEQILYVMGDLCNSKKNTEVFGQTGKGTHYTKCCIEDSGNDTDEQRFLKAPVYNANEDEWDTQDGVDENNKPKYKTHFEWRMEPNAEDKQACIDAWTETAAWVVSVKDDPTKFKEELDQYFVVEPMLYHFLMIEYFAAYDNVSKNTFYSWDWDENADQSKWDGYRWSINKAYDWDTILAYDNDGKPLGDYGIDYGDMENNKSFFNAIQNPIWLHIQSMYKTELNALYTRLRSFGTWNSNAIAKKWDDYQAIRPHAAMVHDAYVKYIYPYKTKDVYLDTTALGYDNNYLGRLAGSKIYQRHQFLTYQTSYMDGKYGYYDQNEALQFRTNGTAGTKDFSIKSYAKTYVTVIRDGQLVESKKVATGGVVEITNVGVGNNTTLYLSPDRLIQHIHPLNETQNSTFVASGAVKLTDVILGGEEVNRSWLNTSNITVTSPILKTLDIHNIETFVSALNLRGNTELTTLDTRNTGAGIITIAPYAPLTSLKLNACAGIVLNNISTITNSDNITIQGTDNLQYITMENCNYTVMSKVMSWLAAALESKTDASDFNIRIIGLRGASEGTRFELSDATILDKLLKASAIDAFGVSGSAPCVLTGLVYIPRVGSEQLKRFREAWPNLDIEAGEVSTQWTVKFVNYNGDPIRDLTGKIYEQIVDDNGQAYDPVAAGEVATPTRPATAEYTYTYSGWDGLEGAVQNATKVVRATYTSAKNRYTITWYAGNQKIKERTEEYGEDISAYTQPEDDPNINFPFVRTDGGVYRVFKGWDRPVGKLTSNTDVYALWDTSTIGENTQDIDLTTVSAADLYAISQLSPATKTRLFSEKSFWDEPIPIKMGNDFYFTSSSNVNTVDLLEGAEELALSGTGTDARVMRNVTPLASLDSDWTLALDYKFLMTVNLKQQNRNEYVLLSCYQNANNSIQGFKISLMPSSNTSDSQMYINVTWGDKTTSTPIDILTLTDKTNTKQYCQSYRNVIVLRHKGGEEQNRLYIYYTGFNGSSYNINAKNSNGDYITEALTTSLTMTQTSAISTPLIIGGNYSGSTTTIETSNSRAPAKAVVYWGKYWNADLGSKYCRQLAAWPHETEYFVLSGYENDQTDITDQTNILDNTKLNLTCVNGFGDRAIITPEVSPSVYGWSTSSLREFCNKRIRSSFPTAYRSIIKQTLITSNYQDFTNNNTTQVEGSTETQDYIYLPSYKEVNATAPSSSMQNNEARRKWPWLIASNITALTPGTDGNNLVAARLTSEALLRCRFFDKPFTTNTRIFYKTENPATTSYIYNDQRVTLQSGDVWYTEDQVVNSDFSGSPNTYIYYTDEEINKGVYVDIVTTNGGWKRAGMQELRTYNYVLEALTGSPVRFYKINTVGTIIPPSNNSAANGYTRIICPEFSL